MGVAHGIASPLTARYIRQECAIPKTFFTTLLGRWEFATEHYDIGFSVSLEYSDAATGATMVVPILPLLRKECERRVVIGSHVSQHSGVYLLKFDNSYSYWRTKQVFFRVFATS